MKFLLTLALLFSTLSFAAESKHCATIFQDYNFSGNSLEVEDGEKIHALTAIRLGRRLNWDNRVTSLKVAAKCKLQGFHYQNFGEGRRTGGAYGWKKSWSAWSKKKEENFELNGTQYNNKISSLTCSCQEEEKIAVDIAPIVVDTPESELSQNKSVD